MSDRTLGFALFGLGMVFGLVVERGYERVARADPNDAVSVGTGIRFLCQSSAPTPVERARLWVRCSDGALVYTGATNVNYVVKP